MTKPETSEIIAALQAFEDYADLKEIRDKLDERAETIKAKFMAQAEAMGLACHDGNDKPRKRRSSKSHDAD